MKKITLAIVAIGTLVGTPALALPPPSATYNWTGFYFGANGGAASAQTSWQYFTVPGNAFISSTPEATSGGLAGGTVGFNYQFGPNMVGGLEADWDWAGLNQSNSCPNPAFSCQVKMGDLGTARARLGWASGPALIYVTGGAAWSNLTIQTVLGG
ncbi:MAG TPA: hypothetical protein VK442_10940, partial [Xanthobacteraceae bacterium]|nr:hypothetical protein [Xanthobacteraceae bacterium]